MKKLVLALIVIVAVTITVAALSLGTWVKSAVENISPQILGVNVTVADVDILLLRGAATIDGFVVDNPEGFSSNHALNLDRVRLHLDIMSLFSDVVTIRELSIVEPVIHYEIAGNGNNLRTLQHNAKRYSRSNASKSTSNDGAEKPSKKVIIENLHINKARISAAIGELQQEVTLPDIHLKDIGKKENGVSFAIASAHVMKTVMRKVSSTDIRAFTRGVKGNVKQNIDEAKEALKGLFK